jgi:hypothetical protein
VKDATNDDLRSSIVEAEWRGDPASATEILAAIPEAEAALKRWLAEAVDAKDWRSFEMLVIAASARPSRLYTSSLCEVIRRHRDDVNLEDIVMLLADGADESAVPCLANLAVTELDWDEYWGVAQKCVYALGRIASRTAVEELKSMAETAALPVREAAEYELNRLGMQD